jgi:propionyl-CoA synthetase
MGKPKGIVRDTGGYAVALKFSKYIYNVKEDDFGQHRYGLGSGSQLHSLRTIIKPKYNHNFEGKPIKLLMSTF